MEEERYNDTETMLKLKYGRQLMFDTSIVFEEFAKKEAVYKVGKLNGKRFKNKSLRWVYKLFRKGLKKIDKKIPVFIELPKLEEQENGQFKEVKNKKQKSDEQIVHISNLPEQVEEKKERTRKMIEEDTSL